MPWSVIISMMCVWPVFLQKLSHQLLTLSVSTSAIQLDGGCISSPPCQVWASKEKKGIFMVIFSIFRTKLWHCLKKKYFFFQVMNAQYDTGMLVSQGVVIMRTGWACGVVQIKTTASFENQVCVLVFLRSEEPWQQGDVLQTSCAAQKRVSCYI